MATSHVIYGQTYRHENEIHDRLRALVGECGGNINSDAARSEWNALNECLESMRTETKRISTVARGSHSTETASFGNGRDTTARHHDPVSQARDSALRACDRHSDHLDNASAERLEKLIRVGDRSGVDSGYLAAVAEPAYNSAFGKVLQHGQMAPLRFSPEEQEAVMKVNAAEEMRTTLQVGSTTAGGFAVPFTLDPSIVLTSAGVQSGVRAHARVETISTDQWKGVSSAGVTAAFAAELTEASDNAPVLAQPVADSAKAQAFIPFSIEIGQDWASLQSEMGRLLADSKNVLEATAFLTGTGTNEPWGILSGATTVVTGAGTAVLAVADIYSLAQALPARFQEKATVAASPTIYDAVYRFVGGGSSEPPLLPTREGPLLGRPKWEWSTMSTVQTTGALNLIIGDWKYFLIADRVGLSVELIPHLFGSSNRYPLGARGLYAYWRTASSVLSANAFRVMKMK